MLRYSYMCQISDLLRQNQRTLHKLMVISSPYIDWGYKRYNESSSIIVVQLIGLQIFLSSVRDKHLLLCESQVCVLTKFFSGVKKKDAKDSLELSSYISIITYLVSNIFAIKKESSDIKIR